MLQLSASDQIRFTLTVISKIKGGSNVDLRQCLNQISLFSVSYEIFSTQSTPALRYWPWMLATMVFFFFWFSKSTSLHINVWICFIWKIVTFYDLQYIKTNIKYNAFSLLFIDVFNTLYLSMYYRAIAFCFFFVLSSISWDACHRYSTNLSSSSPKIYKIHSTCWSPSSIIQIIGNL